MIPIRISGSEFRSAAILPAPNLPRDIFRCTEQSRHCWCPSQDPQDLAPPLIPPMPGVFCIAFLFSIHAASQQSYGYPLLIKPLQFS
jgi:hypothetical protein